MAYTDSITYVLVPTNETEDAQIFIHTNESPFTINVTGDINPFGQYKFKNTATNECVDFDLGAILKVFLANNIASHHKSLKKDVSDNIEFNICIK